jgi:hypothetical protein
MTEPNEANRPLTLRESEFIEGAFWAFEMVAQILIKDAEYFDTAAATSVYGKSAATIADILRGASEAVREHIRALATDAGGEGDGMTDREMLMLAYGALKVGYNNAASGIIPLIEKYLWPDAEKSSEPVDEK